MFVRYILIILMSLIGIVHSFALGLKIIKDYQMDVLSDVMPWQIEVENGWTFIASNDGLIQFDGYFPELFQFNNRRPLRSVTIDKEGKRIYAGGISEFGYFEPSVTKSLEYICLSDSIGEDRHIGNIWGIYNKNGVVIVQADNAIVSYDTNTGKHTLLHSDFKLDGSAWINDILWLATDDGLKIMLGTNILDAPGCELLKGKRIRKILEYGNGYVIVTSDGIWRYNNQQLEYLSHYDDLVKGLGEIFSADIYDDTLALGSVSHGVGIVDLNSGDFTIYNEKNGLPSNTVISLKFDETGNLLTGLQYGLAKIMLKEPVESIDNSLYPIGSGYVLGVLGDKLYMGTNRGLYRMDYDAYNQKLGKNIERIGDLRGQVWGLTVIDGKLLSSHDQGLYEIDNFSSPRRISELTGVWDVRKMLGSADRAYVGSYSGLHTLRKKSGNWEYDSPIEEYWQSIYDFVQEKADVIWNDKSEEGIDRITIDTLNNKVIEVKNFLKTIDGYKLTADVYITRIDNDVYFATGNGIYRYDTKSGEIIKDKDINRLLGNPKSVKRLKKANGNLFALTDNELLVADPAGILDLKRISLSPSVTRTMHEGDVFFPIGNDYLGYPVRTGYLIFDNSDTGNRLWNDMQLKSKINRMIVSSKGDSIVYKGNFGGLKYEPLLNYKENSVRFEYGSFEDLERGVLYSTKLNNEPWSAPASILNKDFTDLKPGKYTFDIKAISPEGKESTESITFRITPPWWSSNWMRTIYAVLIICAIITLLRFSQLQIGKKQRRLIMEKDLEILRQKEEHKKETEEKNKQIEALEKEQIEKELKHKSQEYANMMMSLGHKNDTLQTVKRELQNILMLVPRGHTEARKAITALQDKVVVDIKSDEVLKRVEEEFDIVHDNFIKKLRERYPDLSNNEIMLCAYLKMNLSTKEIAPMLNISQRGAETLRYRLRKKLNLDREESLTSFIARFC